MLSFGDVLVFLMKQHDCKPIALYSRLHMNKSYFSRLTTSKIPPKDYALVEEIASILELPQHEKQMLVTAYKATKFGKDFIALEQTIEKLYHIRFPSVRSTIHAAQPILANGSTIQGMKQVAGAVRSMLSAEGTADFLFIPENTAFCSLLCQLTAEHPQKAECNWLLYLNEEDAAARNVSLFTETLSILLARPANVRFRYKVLEAYYQGTAFPYLLITESSTLLMERSCERAYFFDNPELTDSCRRLVRNEFDDAAPFAVVLSGFEDYLANWQNLIPEMDKNEQDDLLIVEKFPCIIHEAKYSDISSHIADAEQNDQLARAYMQFLKWSTQRLRTQEMMFTEEGIEAYFRMEQFYEYSQHITKSISKPLRRELFQRLISFSKHSDCIIPEILRMPLFRDSNIRVINVWASGIMLIVFHFEECFRIAVLQEKTVATALWDYFQKLKSCGMVLSKEETLELMEKAMEEYGEIHGNPLM